MTRQTQDPDRIATAETVLPEAVVFGPVGASATQLALELRALLRERMGSGTDTYFWPALARGYYVITLDIDDEANEVDGRVPCELVPDDFSLRFWVRRYAHKEDYRQLRRRERRAFVSGRVWTTPEGGTYIGIGRSRYGRDTLDRDQERFFEALADAIEQITGHPYSESEIPTLVGYGMPSYFYPRDPERPHEGLFGPLDVPYLELHRLLHNRLSNHLRLDWPIYQ